MTSVFDAAFDATVRNDDLSVGSKQILVSTSEEFHAAVAELSTGDGGTVLIASDAEPFDMFVRDAGSETGKIVITSEDPDQQSHVYTARVLDSENVTFENLYINGEDSDRASYLSDAYVVDSKNIAFIGNTFDGPREEMQVEEPDLVVNMSYFDNVDGLLIEGNYMAGYEHGIRIFDSNDVLVDGNEITEMQGDGLHGGGWQDVKISNNYIHEQYGASQEISHNDMIQLWGGFGLEATDGVVIEGNLLDSGDGPAYQSVFIRNVTDGITHQNIHVLENVIYNGHPNGIRISGAEDTVVDSNTVLWNQASTQYINLETTIEGHPQINIDDPTGIITNNIAARITGTGGTEVGDNAIISYTDATDPDYYSNHFASLEEGGARSAEALQLVPDSSFVGIYGAENSLPTTTADDLTPIMMQSLVTGSRATINLDASLTRDENGYVDADDATFTWTFADGVEFEGISLERSFPTGDQMDVTLTVTHSDGSVASIDRTLAFDRNDIADVDFNGGLDATADLAEMYESDASDFETSGGRTVFHMDGTNGFEFDSADSAWGGLSSFSMDIDIQKDDADGSGRILNLQKAMKLYIDDKGSVIFQLSTDEGDFTVTSDAGAISDTDWHSVNVSFNSDDGSLSVSVDGDMSEVDATGTTPGQTAWGLQVGGNMHATSIAANIDNFKVVSDPNLESQAQVTESTIDLTAVADVQAVVVQDTVDAAAPAGEPEVVAEVVEDDVVIKITTVPVITTNQSSVVTVTEDTATTEVEAEAVAEDASEAEALDEVETIVEAPIVADTEDDPSEGTEEPVDAPQASSGSESFFSKLMSTLLGIFGFDRSSGNSDNSDSPDAIEDPDAFHLTDDPINAIFFSSIASGADQSEAPFEDDEDDDSLALEA